MKAIRTDKAVTFYLMKESKREFGKLERERNGLNHSQTRRGKKQETSLHRLFSMLKMLTSSKGSQSKSLKHLDKKRRKDLQTTIKINYQIR